MRKLSLKQKIFFIIIATLISLFIVESGFKIAEFISRRFYLPDYNYSTIAKDEKVIFCIGGSITYGVGVDFVNSYPLQLERILKGRFNLKKVKVFNLGVPGYDSSQILKRFKSQLKTIKPDIVVTSMGANDYLAFDARPQEEKLRLAAKLKKFILATKISRFFSIFRANIRNANQNKTASKDFYHKEDQKSEVTNIAESLKQANLLRSKSKFEKAETYYNDILKKYPFHKTTLLESGRNYKLAGKFEEALNIFLKLFVKYPNDSEAFYEIKDTLIRQKDTHKMVAVYLTLHKKFPASDKISEALSAAYITLGGKYFLKDKLEEAENLYLKALALDAGKCYSHDEALKEIIIYKKIYNNMEELAHICKENKITLIVCGYPTFLPRAVEHAAVNHELILIDHSSIFENESKKFPNKRYFISDKDPHCTKEGYRLIAENVARTIITILR